MEVRIKNNNEMIDAIIEMVDGVMVVSPKEVKFEPKDGDVIVSGGDTRFVAIFEMMKNEYSFYYYSLLVLEGDKRPQINNLASFLNVRPATEEEKQKLFDKLAEDGLAWDAERKELVKLKWKPKEGGELWYPYYVPSRTLFIPSISLFNFGRDKNLFNKGWCFKTEQECQELCKRLNEVINSVKP